ncbi:hypothetical protein ACWKSP_27560 [Micromonosporaceae bacterium Da 78-11]
MRSMLQLVGGVAVAGAVAAGSTAFTATGVTSTAPASQFVGGTVSQSVTGAALSNIAYTFSDPTNTIISSVTLTFLSSSADGKTVTLAPTGGSFVGTATQWTCATGANSTVCSVKDVSTVDVTGAPNGRSGLTSLAVTVA